MMKKRPYVCQSHEIPGSWAGGWLCVTKRGVTAHRTRDSAYRQIEQESLTPVLFRTDRAGQFKGQVTAVFPTLPGTSDVYTMTCYAHVGQHSSCDLGWVSTTRAATPDEYAALKRELESAPFGYRLEVYQRMQHGFHKTRRDALQKTGRLRA